MRIALLFSVLTASALGAAAQPASQTWFNSIQTYDLSERFALTSDFQLRFRDDGNLGQGLFMIGAGWNINSTFSLWGGYEALPTYPVTGPTVTENRIWSSLVAHPDWKGFLRFGARLRLENRLVIESNYSLRARLRVHWRSPEFLDGVSIWISEEILVQSNTVSWGPEAGAEQNRFLATIRFQLANGVRFEPGYLQLYRFSDRTLFHIPYFGLFLRF